MWILLFIFIAVCNSNQLTAQLFADKQTYPWISTIKTKSFNGCAKGYWSWKNLDAEGSITTLTNYKRSEMLSQCHFIYNQEGDKILDIFTFDINNPGIIDSIRYDYRYDSTNTITFQSVTYNKDYSNSLELIDAPNDTTLSYRYASHYYRHDLDSIIEHIEIYTLKRNSKTELVFFQQHDPRRNTKTITRYAYFQNGNLRNRTIERSGYPSMIGMVYVGGPGSDNMDFAYAYDKSGRVKREYTIIDQMRYKTASFIYYHQASQVPTPPGR